MENGINRESIVIYEASSVGIEPTLQNVGQENWGEIYEYVKIRDSVAYQKCLL